MGSGVAPALWPPEILRLFSVFGFLLKEKKSKTGGHGGPPHHSGWAVGANLVFALGEPAVRPYVQMNLEVLSNALAVTEGKRVKWSSRTAD